jgi:hypothetical protein
MCVCARNSPAFTSLCHVFMQWMTKNGWKMIGTQCCGPAGSVVIYDETSAGNDHAAFSVGGGLICQHNPGRCRCPPTIPNCSVRRALLHPRLRSFVFKRCRISRAPTLQHLGRLGLAPRLLLRLLKSKPQKEFLFCQNAVPKLMNILPNFTATPCCAKKAAMLRRRAAAPAIQWGGNVWPGHDAGEYCA